MNIQEIVGTDPARWGDILLLIIGASGFAAAVGAVSSGAKIGKEGLYYILSNLRTPIIPDTFEDNLIKVAIPFVITMGAFILAVVGGYTPLSMDTWFAAAQVAGTVAAAPYILGFIKDGVSSGVQKVKDNKTEARALPPTQNP